MDSDPRTRRRVLQGIGAAGIAGALGLQPASATESFDEQTPRSYELGNIDPNRTVWLDIDDGEDIVPYLHEHFVDDTEVIIPTGTYRWGSNTTEAFTAANAILRGEGPAADERPIIELHEGQPQNWRLNATGVGIALQHVEMHNPVGGDRAAIAVHTDSDSTEFRMHNVHLPDGAIDGASSATGLFLFEDHAGYFEMVDCHLYNWTDNAAYLSEPGDPDTEWFGDPQAGRIEVIRGLYKSSDIAAVRVAGDVYLEQVVVVQDEVHEHADGGWQRGFWLRDAHEDALSGVTKDLDIEVVDCHCTVSAEFTTGGHATPVVLQTRDRSTTEGHMQDVKIRNDYHDESAVARYGNGDADWTAAQLHVTGDGAVSTEAVTAACRGDSCTEPRTTAYPAAWETSRLAVETLDATDIGQTSATLNGELADLGNDEATVSFDWGEAGTGLPNTTDPVTRGTPDSFDLEVASLDKDTDYEFRARAEAGDDVDTGVRRTFTTLAGEDTPSPTIDRFELEDRSNPEWARVGIDWAVSDGDSNLDTVESVLEYLDVEKDAESSSVSGPAAEGDHDLRYRDGHGITYYVTLIVTDTDGNRTSQTKQITL